MKTSIRAFPGLLSAGLAAILLFGSSRLAANGFRNPPEGAFGLGCSGGKIANVDDPSAVSLNPANLVELRAPSFYAGSTVLYADTTVNTAGGQETSTRDPVKTIPDLYAVWPFPENRCALGLGLTVPFGQSTVWGKHSIFRYAVPWYAELAVVDVNPTFALKLNDDLAVGAGLDCFLSRLTMRQFYPWSGLTGSPADSDGEAEFRADGSGWGGNLGITWKFLPRQRLAATWRSAVDVEYSGDLHVTNLPVAARLPPPFRGVTSRSPYHTGIEFPAIVTLGYGIDATDTLRLGADVEWVQFSSYQVLRTNLDNNDVLLASTSTAQNWKDIFTFGYGAEWRFRPAWALRTGYQFLPSPIPDDTFSPVLPDADKHVVSVGLAHQVGPHSFQLSYAEAFSEQRVIADNRNPAFNGSYRLSSHLLSVAYRYSF